MEVKRFLSIHILAALLLLGFVYYVTIFVFIEDCFGIQSSVGLLNSMIFSFLAKLCVFTFLLCVCSDPGGVPSGYVPDVEENQGSDSEFKKNSIQPRQCDKCSAHKPPRAHHCRVCRRCVLRMDHHCAWINNCVGHKNYKSYLLLVFYTAIASMYSTTLIISCTLRKDWDYNGSNHIKNFYVGCGVLCIGLSLTLGSLLIWHIYLTLHNMTTIEYHEGKRAAWLARKSGMNYHHPYDVGSYKNLTLVLGPNMLKWLWPASVSHIKDGLSFPTTTHASTA